jgi:hypothetical protein
VTSGDVWPERHAAEWGDTLACIPSCFALTYVTVHTLACQLVSNVYTLLHRHSLNNSLDRPHTQAVSPRKGESESEFGLRCWQAGQSGRLVSDWNRVKVDVMCVAACIAFGIP